MSDKVSLEKINPAALKEAEWLAKRDDVIASLELIEVVNSDDNLKVSGPLQTKATKLIKDLGDMRMRLTRPLDDKKKEIMDAERELKDKLESELERIKGLNNTYATKVAMAAHKAREDQASQQREADQQAADEQKARQEKATEMFGENAVLLDAPVVPEQIPIHIPKDKVSTGSNKTVFRWKQQVFDSAKVPREFCTVDEKKIRAFQKSEVALGRDPVVPGVKFEKIASVELR